MTGGKPYYLAGLYPVLLAAGAQPVLDWARAGPQRRGRPGRGTGVQRWRSSAC